MKTPSKREHVIVTAHADILGRTALTRQGKYLGVVSRVDTEHIEITPPKSLLHPFRRKKTILPSQVERIENQKILVDLHEKFVPEADYLYEHEREYLLSRYFIL